MQLNTITFKPDVKGEAEPDTVTVTLTRREVAFIAKLVAGQSDIDSNEVMPGGSKEGSAIFRCLVYGVANPHYETGLDGLMKSVKE